MRFSRQEYWSGLPFPSPGDLSDPGIKPWSSSWQANSLSSEPPGKPDGGRVSWCFKCALDMNLQGKLWSALLWKRAEPMRIYGWGSMGSHRGLPRGSDIELISTGQVDRWTFNQAIPLTGRIFQTHQSTSDVARVETSSVDPRKWHPQSFAAQRNSGTHCPNTETFKDPCLWTLVNVPLRRNCWGLLQTRDFLFMHGAVCFQEPCGEALQGVVLESVLTLTCWVILGQSLLSGPWFVHL